MDPFPPGRRRAAAPRVAPGAAVALAWLLCAATPSPARAAIHACPMPDGTVQFQDRPCERTAPPERDTGARAANLAHRAPPLGIDPSWFAVPSGTAHAALCDDRGCRCGPARRVFGAGLAVAVADALWLDGAWHRHARLAEVAEREGSPSARAALDAAACDVLMSQDTLLRHGERALARLSRRAANAVDLGRDTEAACDGFSAGACRDYEALLLHRRARADARALAAPRREVLAGSAAADPD